MNQIIEDGMLVYRIFDNKYNSFPLTFFNKEDALNMLKNIYKEGNKRYCIHVSVINLDFKKIISIW